MELFCFIHSVGSSDLLFTANNENRTDLNEEHYRLVSEHFWASIEEIRCYSQALRHFDSSVERSGPKGIELPS